MPVKQLKLPVTIMLDREITALVVVPRDSLCDWLSSLCLLRLGFLDSITVVNVRTSPATIIITSNTGMQMTAPAELIDEGLRIIVTREQLDSWIAIFQCHDRGEADVKDNEINLRLPADRVRMGLDVNLTIAVEDPIPAEGRGPNVTGETERQVLTLLHQIGNPDVLQAARELERVVADLESPGLEDLDGDIWSIVEILGQVPQLIQMVEELFAASGETRGQETG